MDSRRNRYAPCAGPPPTELAGRSALLERNAAALVCIRAGRAARRGIFYGLRGVSKTVVLTRMRDTAEVEEFTIV